MTRQHGAVSNAAILRWLLPLLCAMTAAVFITGCAAPAGNAAQHHAEHGATKTEPDAVPPAKTGPSPHKIPLSSIPSPRTPLLLLGTGELNGLTPYPWQIAGVEDNGRAVLVVVPAGTAMIRGAEVREEQEDVRLTIYGVSRPTGPVSGISVNSVFLVRLPNPLGARHIVAG